MDTIVIVLIIIILILLYVLYKYSTKSTANVSSKLYNLNNSNSTISSADLANPQSQRFSYSTWVYVNTWNTTMDKLIYFSGTANSTTGPIVALRLGATSPTLTAKVGNNNPITITQNFPIQKWVHVVISVDSQIVDCYLDGKLVSSTQMISIQSIPSAYAINFGVFDAYLTGFKYKSTPLNPQQVWSEYMAGNGYTGGKYGVNFAITKDDSVISQVSY